MTELRPLELKNFVRSPLLWFLLTLIATAIAIVVRFAILGSADEDLIVATSIFLDFLLAVIVSFVFYFLVVFLPEKQRKSILKNQISSTYKDLKRSILQEIVHGSIIAGRKDLNHSTELVDRLLDLREFRKEFSKGREATEGYYAFSNHLNHDSPQFQEIMLNLKQMNTQIVFLLNHYNFDDPELFEFFKRLELHLLRLERVTPDHDGSGPLLRFLYDVCSGWNFIAGYQDEDPILTHIKQL